MFNTVSQELQKFPHIKINANSASIPIKILNNKSGVDIHTFFKQNIHINLRNLKKSINIQYLKKSKRNIMLLKDKPFSSYYEQISNITTKEVLRCIFHIMN